MSFRRYARAAFWLSKQVLFRLNNRAPSLLKAIAVYKSHPQMTAITFARKMRLIFRGVRTRAIVRPFSVLDHNRLRYNERAHRNARFRAWFILSDSSSPENIFERIKQLFLTNIRYNPNLSDDELPARLDAYVIGSNIACGCHAAVYELRLRNRSDSLSNDKDNSKTIEMEKQSENNPSYNNDPLVIYPLALKIMFNYQFDAPERLLWIDMGPELIPFKNADKILGKYLPKLRILPKSHPNVIKIYTAFTDRMPILSDARSLYPEALPNANFYELIIEEPKTLFIVMKRYRMTLREYVLTVKRNLWSARVLFAQLLEAIVFLYENMISHRDMKSDNILLDFDSPDTHSVVQIRNARPGPNQYVNFRMADLWAAATLGYEIYTRYIRLRIWICCCSALLFVSLCIIWTNPFYSRLKSCAYAEQDLPELPKQLPCAIKTLIKEMLRCDPTERPDPRVAANVLCVSLFRCGDNELLQQSLLNESTMIMPKSADSENERKETSKLLSLLRASYESRLDDLVLLYTAETILAKRPVESGKKTISAAELQVMGTQKS
ncbi:unnamed protein product [Anisakis simplex]|uniref:non-specific serine/threonine protein kinase n=1 Tax=Anisakis simplex TaxID=6269 RepID=A0A0M3JWG8_ANISI|nr:unnamed protein product [Anisakis simplex]